MRQREDINHKRCQSLRYPHKFRYNSSLFLWVSNAAASRHVVEAGKRGRARLLAGRMTVGGIEASSTGE